MWRHSSCKLDFMTVMLVIILNGQLPKFTIYFLKRKTLQYSNPEIILFPGYSLHTHFTIHFTISIIYFFIGMAPHNLTAIYFTVGIRLSSAVLSSLHQRTNPWPTGLLPLHLEPLVVCMFAFHCVNFMLPLFSVDRLGVM